MEKGIFDVYPTKPTARPEPLSNPSHLFHSERNFSNRRVEVFQIENGSPFVRGSL